MAKAQKESSHYKCGKCGESGHNARSCTNDGKAETPKKAKAEKPKKAKAEKSSSVADSSEDVAIAIEDSADETEAPDQPDVEESADGEEVFDLSDGAELPADPFTPPPGAKLNIPKRKRERSKAEEAFWAATEKKLAPDSVAPAGELTLRIPRISTGNFGLDVATFGGIPQGRFIRFWGSPKSGKTGSCLNTVATYQREHCSECFQRECECKNRDVPEVVWVDAENRMNSMLYWPQEHGINLDCLRILCPPTGQNVVDFVDHIIREGQTAKVGLIIVDSLAHIVSQDELNKPTLDGVTVGRNAHLLNSAWRKWTSAIMSLGIQNERKPTVLCINQMRQKIGVTYGSPDIMPGGVGQDFATTVDIKFQNGPPTFVVWDEKKRAWIAKEKKGRGSYEPSPDETPDFVKISYRITASGFCPPGRNGEFNYWLKSTHGHRCGDPDNGLQLWNYAKRYDLIQQEGHEKILYGLRARTLDELREVFRGDQKAQKKAWTDLMKILIK